MQSRTKARCNQAGFTLIELLVVVAIIGILAAILIPTIRGIQSTAKATASQNVIVQIQTAIEAYHQDYNAYPGPLHNYQVRNTTAAAGSILTDKNGQTLTDNKITMSENLVLGLLGGLVFNPTVVPPNNPVQYDRTVLLGARGPAGLNPALPKQGRSYLSIASLFERGAVVGAKFSDDVGTCDDSEIPEFVDAFSSPMPILYLRALPERAPAGGPTGAVNRVITDSVANAATHGTPNEGPYDVCQIYGYTGSDIGVGKQVDQVFAGSADTPTSGKGKKVDHGLRSVTIPPNVLTPKDPAYNSTNYVVPYDALSYFRDPSTGTTALPGSWAPRQKDRFILICAGKDRVYGTADDITSFGDVSP